MAALLIAGGLERFRCEEWLLRCQALPYRDSGLVQWSFDAGVVRVGKAAQ